MYNLEKKKLKQVLNKAGKHKNLVADELGTQLAFVCDTDTTAKNEKLRIRNFQLYYWQSKAKTAQVLADSTNGKIQKSWIINEYQKPKFAKNGSKLYFATNPRPILQDTSLLKEEVVNVEVLVLERPTTIYRTKYEIRTRKKARLLGSILSQGSKSSTNCHT